MNYNYLVWLVPIALGMGLVGLACFLWSMRNGQYEDLDGAAERILIQDGPDRPLSSAPEAQAHQRVRNGDGTDGTR